MDEHVTVADLVGFVATRLKRDGRDAYLKVLPYQARRLLEVFGERLASTITPHEIEQYIDLRLGEGRKPATVNRELYILRSGFLKAVDLGLVERAPKIAKLREDNVREGLVMPEAFQILLRDISRRDTVVADIVHTLWITGWRKGEVMNFRWEEIDMEEGLIRLPGRRSKNRVARQYPIQWALRRILMRYSQTTEWVWMRRNGTRVRDFRALWKSSTKRAGLSGLLIHDFRRSWVHRAIQSGLNESVVQKLGGWKSRTVFQRYNIVNEAELREYAEQIDAPPEIKIENEA